LSEEDRNYWEEIARQDKARFEIEKSIYSGPWRVPVKKRLQDDPNIPKRPMSAFLAFSHDKRSEEKQKNPDFNNIQISRHLAQLWKEAKEEDKKKYIDQEYTLRQKYLVNIASWRQENEKEMAEQRKRREDFAMRKIIDGKQNQDQSSTSYPQSSDYFSPHESDKPPSIPSEQVAIWNQYSDYATHYNYYPVSTMVEYAPHSDEQYVTYPQHHYYQSSASSAPYDPPPNYSQSEECSHFYASRNEYSEGEWTSEQNVNVHPPQQYMQNYHYNVARSYSGKQIDKAGNVDDSFLPNFISSAR
jgi:hypothetical protein